MAKSYLTDPNLSDANVEHDAAVGEQITTPYCFDALDGLDLGRGVQFLGVATGT